MSSFLNLRIGSKGSTVEFEHVKRVGIGPAFVFEACVSARSVSEQRIGFQNSVDPTWLITIGNFSYNLNNTSVTDNINKLFKSKYTVVGCW